MWITSTLRGVVNVTVKVQVLKEGVHSGDASGTIFKLLYINNFH